MKQKKSTYTNIFITLEVAAFVTILLLVVFTLTGDITLKSNKSDSTSHVSQIHPETANTYEDNAYTPTPEFDESEITENISTDNPIVPNINAYPETTLNLLANQDTASPNTSAPNISSNSTTQMPDLSNYSTAEIIAKAKNAVNKTKGYSGNLKVNHHESFSANVTECSGGAIVKSVVDLMIGMVVKPVDETLHFQNGKAVNSEGETIPILLPKKGAFALSESGVKSASIQRTGNEYTIKINLIEEHVGMYDVPTHNASSVGYLDVANFDISFMEIDSANIVYKGSSLELKINADGYVTYANYKIPLHIDGSAHKGSISGSAKFEGEQTETWIFNY